MEISNEAKRLVENLDKAAERWANRLDFKTVVEPLIIKPIVNPLELPKVSEPTNEQIGWLNEWQHC